MKKLLRWHDAYTLKILVGVLIAFTALYPKLPSVNIQNTWVYIRLEDFLILSTVGIWFGQLLRKKVTIFKPIAISIGLYWLVGLISLIWSIFYLAPNLPELFPHVAILSYIRRIEYMILFFVAFSTINDKRDLRDYLFILSATIIAIFIYGIGQRYYIILWSLIPSINQAQFCFPSFQTGNEEFAKGLALCLPPGGRITSTFGGSYDLGAYTVLITPIILGVFLAVKKRIWKILTGIVFLSSLTLLILTAQRASFIAYILGGIFTLILFHKKKWIVPLLLLSFSFLFIFNEGTAKRFLSTFRVSEVVVDQEGRLIGDAQIGQIDPRTNTRRPESNGDLPLGSAFIGLPQDNLRATDSAIIERTLTPEEARRLRLEGGSIQISTVSGSFLVKKVLVYDISFTTRFQAEWPNAWAAYERNPLLGSGYSSITLATDNDYFRALGETGLLGFLSFFGIFVVIWAVIRALIPLSKSQLTNGFVFGLLGGIVGLLINATLIDVFEASKVAENLWLLTGIGIGALTINQEKKINYFEKVIKVLSSNLAYLFYLLLIILLIFLPTYTNFFVADDFTWLKWAAEDNSGLLVNHFIDSHGFFYRPLVKIITFGLYNLFSFQPQGYHVFVILLHLLMSIGAFIFSKKIVRNNLLAFLTSAIFAVHPTHAENVFWYSGLSSVLASVFMLFGCLSFIRFRQRRSIPSYILTFILGLLALGSYEMAVAFPLLLLVVDIYISGLRKIKYFLVHLSFLLLIPGYYFLRIATNTFQSGGDYSYNLYKIIQNTAGNIIGYIGLFLGGDLFLPIYNNLRAELRTSSNQIGLVLIGIFILLAIIIYNKRSAIKKLFQHLAIQRIIFGLFFAIVSVLPFLPLGNIAPRYLYLASVGLSISTIVIIDLILEKVLGGRKNIKIVVLLIATTIYFSFFTIQISKISKNWTDAGFVAKNTLFHFRSKYPELKKSDTIYIVNNPVSYKGVWTFPTGIDDGLWFVYRENLPNIKYTDSVKSAKNQIKSKNNGNSYIFIFDKFGDIRELQAGTHDESL